MMSKDLVHHVDGLAGGVEPRGIAVYQNAVLVHAFRRGVSRRRRPRTRRRPRPRLRTR